MLIFSLGLVAAWSSLATSAPAVVVVEATVGGGMVTVVANGKQEIVSIKIEPQVLDDFKSGELDVAMLEDLIASGANAALNKSRELVQQEMSKLTGGLRIPGLF